MSIRRRKAVIAVVAWLFGFPLAMIWLFTAGLFLSPPAQHIRTPRSDVAIATHTPRPMWVGVVAIILLVTPGTLAVRNWWRDRAQSDDAGADLEP